MPSTKYPNSGIYGGWSRGENGWGYDMNDNLLLTDALLHAVVKSKIKSIPTTVKLGDLYLVDTTGLSTDLSTKKNHLILFKSSNKSDYIDIPPLTGNKIYLVTNNTSYVYKSNAWVKDEIELATSLTDSSEEKAASAKLTYELNNKIVELDGRVTNLDKELDSKYDELLDKINEKTEVGNGTTEINNDFNNLSKTGKFLVHTVKGTTKNPPINITGDWWVDVFTYGSGSSKKILQEALLHGTSSSSATSGPANRLVRCCTNTTWSPWQYSYSQFAG